MGLPATPKNSSLTQPSNPKVAGRELNKTQKAAIILASLTQELATQIVAEISDEQLRRFAIAFAELEAVPMEVLNSVLLEFIAEVRQFENQLFGGDEEVQRVLSQVADAERTDRVLKTFAKEAPRSVWKDIEAIEPQVLSNYFCSRKPSVAAAVMSRLDYEKTAAILKHCDEQFAQSVLLALSKYGPPSDRVIEEIAAAIEAELLAPLAAKPDYSGAARFVGEIVNFLPGERRDRFLEFLKANEAELATEVRKSLLIFEDLHHRLPNNAVVALTKDVDRSVLLCALKYGQQNANDATEFIFSNMSKRMAEQFREELSEIKDLDSAEGEEAQRRVVSFVKKLAADGEITLQDATTPVDD